jgi:quinol monooxygenase YgiN
MQLTKAEIPAMFVVVVDFVIRLENRTRFLALVAENAHASVTFEKGCLQFDVCTDNDAPDRILLYEAYVDAEAFEFHKRTEHFATFDRESRELVSEKRVRCLTRYVDGSAEPANTGSKS